MPERYGRNFDLDALAIQADLGGGWETINGDVVNVQITNAVEVDTLNQAPTAGRASLVINSKTAHAYFGNIFGIPCRVRYQYSPTEVATLFAGTVRGVSATAAPGDRPTIANKYGVTLECVSAMYDLSRRHLSSFTAPAETCQQRLIRIMDELGLTANVHYAHVGLGTYSAGEIREAYTGDALSLLNELALMSHARWFVRPATNELIMRDDQPTVVATFDPGNERDFIDAQYGYSDENYLSRSVAQLASNEAVTDVSTHSAPAYIKSEQYRLDLADADQLHDWNLAVKLQGNVPFMPVSLRTGDVAQPWQNINPLSLIEVKLPHRTTVTTVGLTSITHDITPQRWMAELSFCSKYFVDMEDGGDA